VRYSAGAPEVVRESWGEDARDDELGADIDEMSAADDSAPANNALTDGNVESSEVDEYGRSLAELDGGGRLRRRPFAPTSEAGDETPLRTDDGGYADTDGDGEADGEADADADADADANANADADADADANAGADADADGGADAEQGSLVPGSPAEPLDDMDDDDDIDNDDDDDTRNPRKRRRSANGDVMASDAAATAASTASNEAVSGGGNQTNANPCAPAPSTAAPAPVAKAASENPKVRVYLSGCNTRIDVPVNLSLKNVLIWEQKKKKAEAEKRGTRFHWKEPAAALVHNVPMPLRRTFAELTAGARPGGGGGWEVEVKAIPIASPLGLEVCRRTLLLALSLAAARVRVAHHGLSFDSLPLRAVTAHGLYLGVAASSPMNESSVRKLCDALRAALYDVIGISTPTTSRTRCVPEAIALLRDRRLELSEQAARATSAPFVTCDGARDGTAEHFFLSHGAYTTFPLPALSDLAGSKIEVHPLPSSAIFVHFAPPAFTLLPFEDAEMRALLIAAAEIDDQSRLLQVTTAARLNDIVAAGERSCKRHIELAEAQLARRLSGFADRVVGNRARLLLISAQAHSGVGWLSHALELQLRVRELRGVSIDAGHWAHVSGDGSRVQLRVHEMRADLATLYATGRVALRGALRADGSVGPPMEAELPSGGYVMVYGEELQEALSAADASSGSSGPLAELPTPHFKVQALPLCSVAVDESTCVGGGVLLLLRLLARAVADGESLVRALRLWTRRRLVELERASEHIDLSVVGAAVAREWKPLNFSFAYELSIYSQLLLPSLRTVPSSDEVTRMTPQARLRVLALACGALPKLPGRTRLLTPRALCPPCVLCAPLSRRSTARPGDCTTCSPSSAPSRSSMRHRPHRSAPSVGVRGCRIAPTERCNDRSQVSTMLWGRCCGSRHRAGRHSDCPVSMRLRIARGSRRRGGCGGSHGCDGCAVTSLQC